MTRLTNCRCIGSFCNCTGVAVLKDGHSMRAPVMMKDGAISGEKHVTNTMTIADRAALPKYDHLRGGFVAGGMCAATRAAMQDAASEAHAAAHGEANNTRATAERRAADAWMGDRSLPAPSAREKEARDHAFAEARASGMNDSVASAHAAREAYKHRLANAHRAA